MAQTRIGVADPRAVKRWSSALAVDTLTSSYFSRKFMSSESISSLVISKVFISFLQQANGGVKSHHCHYYYYGIDKVNFICQIITRYHSG